MWLVFRGRGGSEIDKNTYRIFDIQDNVPTYSYEYEKAVEEERRIFYVGITRAKEKLTIFKYTDKQSVFINELRPQTEEKIKEETKAPAGSYAAAASSYLNRMRKQS